MYRTVAQIDSATSILSNWFPQFFTRVQLPEASVLGHAVYALRMRAGSGTGRRGVLIVGGTHLLPATDEEITRVATVLRDTWKVEWIAPTHCTGEPAFAILQKTFKDRYMYTGLGSTLVVGPRVLSYQDSGTLQFAQPMDADERQTYRDLLAAGLDEEMPVLLQPTIRRSLTLRKLMRKQVRRASKREAE